MINDSLIEMDLLENSFLEESEEVETEIKIPAVEVNADPAHEAEPDEVPPVDINTVEDKFEEDIESKGAAHIVAMKSDPHNVPVIRDVEENKYYIDARDLCAYMECSLTIDPVDAMNNIAEAMIEEGANVTPENLYVVGASHDIETRLNECGVLLEISAKNVDITKVGTKFDALSKIIYNKVKKVEFPTSTAYTQEADRLRGAKEDAQNELKDIKSGKKMTAEKIKVGLIKCLKNYVRLLPAYLLTSGAVAVSTNALAKSAINSIFSMSENDMKKIKIAGIGSVVSTAAYSITSFCNFIKDVIDIASVITDYEKVINDYIKHLDRLIDLYDSKAKEAKANGK
ncbi:MAG: hypothetical protein IKA36_06145 [Clostridia bacterium]|nr:hypothetical protein [Clostridia bacterium]